MSYVSNKKISSLLAELVPDTHIEIVILLPHLKSKALIPQWVLHETIYQ